MMKKGKIAGLIVALIFMLGILAGALLMVSRVSKRFAVNFGIMLVIEIIYFIILKALKLSKPKGQRIVEAASRNGRMLKAKRVGEVKKKKRTKRVKRGGEWKYEGHYYKYFAKYEYEVEGRTYKHKYRSASEPKEELTLFYPIGRPGKAITEEESRMMNGFRQTFLVFIVPMIILFTIFILH